MIPTVLIYLSHPQHNEKLVPTPITEKNTRSVFDLYPTTDTMYVGASFSLLMLSASSAAAATDYGYWNVTYTGGASATGYRYHDIAASYSGYAPDRKATCHWLYSPEFRNETLTCNDHSFSYELVDSQRSRFSCPVQ